MLSEGKKKKKRQKNGSQQTCLKKKFSCDRENVDKRGMYIYLFTQIDYS